MELDTESNTKITIKEKDYSISFVRVVSMFLIILTHILNQISEVAFLAQVTNAAVYTFLFISGYLFGTKPINNNKVWFKKMLKMSTVEKSRLYTS